MLRRKRLLMRVSAVLLALLLCLSLSACGKKAGMEFTRVLNRDVLTLDPQAASRDSERQILGEIFEGLCRVGENGEAAPGVAKSWSSEDGDRLFTFKLRKARWSDGEPVTASDFIFGIKRALRRETNAKNASDLFMIKNARGIYDGTLSEDSLGVKANGEREIIFELESPCPDFPLYTAGIHYMPCREDFFRECAGHYGLSAEYILTNGPFTFSSIYSWDTGYSERSVKLSASSTYKGERSALPASVTYMIDYDESWDADPLSALNAGSVDIWQASRTILEKNSSLEEISAENAVCGLLLNPNDERLGDIEFRGLLFGSIDREDLTLRAKGLGDAADGIVPSSFLFGGEPYYESGSGYPGWTGDIPATLKSYLSTEDLDRIPSITVLCADDQASIDIANGLLISWNNALGGAFNIFPMPYEELYYRILTGEYEAALYNLTPAGETAFHCFTAFSSEASPQLLNSPEYDDALNAIAFDRRSMDELELALAKELVFYPICQTKTSYLVSDKAGSISVLKNGLVEFSEAKKRS